MKRKQKSFQMVAYGENFKCKQGKSKTDFNDFNNYLKIKSKNTKIC